jgi:hypothetical protein
MDFMAGRALGKTMLVLAAPALLAACGSGSQPVGSPSGAPEVTQAAALPDGLAIMPGAKVTSTEAPGGGQAGAPTSQVQFEVAASSADVAKFYKAEFARVGLTVENDMTMQGNMILSGKAHNGEDIVINASDGTGGGATQVTVSTAKTAG